MQSPDLPENQEVRLLFFEAAHKFAINVEDIKAKKKHKSLVTARRWLAHEMHARWNWGLTEIGRALGLDHSSIYNYLRTKEQVASAKYRRKVRARRRLRAATDHYLLQD